MFKVGDKVKCISAPITFNQEKYLGKIVTISKVNVSGKIIGIKEWEEGISKYWIYCNEWFKKVPNTKFEVGEEVLDIFHKEKSDIVAIIKPSHGRDRRYVIIHKKDGYATIHPEERIEKITPPTPSLVGKEVEVKVNGVTYKAIIKEENLPF